MYLISMTTRAYAYKSKFPRKQPMSLATNKKDMQQDKQIQNLKKKVKKIEYNEEVKYFDFGALNNAIVETGTQLAGGGIAYAIVQGDGSTSRDGNEIITTSMLIRANITADVDKLSASFVRMVVYWDSQANGAINSTAGAEGSNSLMLASALVPGHLDFRNQATIDRFTILYDKVFTLNPQVVLTTAAGITTQNIPVELFISKRFKLGRKIQYDANTGTVTDLVKNNICVTFISDNSTDPPLIDYNMRLYFKDL